jgi:murein DD-endopeptidase MepM/ murein hydrolase activator NlpD
MLPKIRIEKFPEGTESVKSYRISLWKPLFWLIAIVGTGLFFLNPDLTELVRNLSDPRFNKMRKLNHDLRSSLKQAELDTMALSQGLKRVMALQERVSDLSGTSSFNNKKPIMQNLAEASHLNPDEKLDILSGVYTRFLDQLLQNPVIAKAIPVAYPLPANKKISTPLDSVIDPFTRQKLPHLGVDFPAMEGDTVYATGGGQVIRVQVQTGFGSTLTLQHTSRIESFYAHLQKPLVRLGQSVKRGTPIALVGSSGRSSGSHLHYEIRVDNLIVNPESVFLPF